MKKNFLIVLMCLLGLGGYYLFTNFNNSAKQIAKPTQSEPSVPHNSKPIENKEVDLNSWQTHSNTNFSFKYPSEAKAETRNDSSISLVESVVFFMGQKQITSGRTQTELFDGYIFNIRDITSEVIGEFEAFALAERNNSENGCENDNGLVSELQTVNIGSAAGYQFSVTNCYVDHTQTLLSANGKLYRISQSYVGDEEDYLKYKEITFTILNTLSFTK